VIVFSSNGRSGTLAVVREATPDRYEVLADAATRQGARPPCAPRGQRTHLSVRRGIRAVSGTHPGRAASRATMNPDSFTDLLVGRQPARLTLVLSVAADARLA
jgi:hypothetical protein